MFRAASPVMMPKQLGILRPIANHWARLTALGSTSDHKQLASSSGELDALALERAYEVARLRQILKDIVRQAELGQASTPDRAGSDE